MPEHDPFAPASAVPPPGGDTAPSTSAPAAAPEPAPTPDATPAGTAAEPVTPEPTTTSGDTQTPADADGTGDAAAADGKGADGAETPAIEVPAGTTKEVLAWVGDDQDKARAALAAEQASDEPRTGLSRKLEELVG